MTDIIIELENSKESIQSIEKCEGVNVINSDRFEGGAVLQVIITLGTISIPLVAKIIIENLRANKHVVVKHKGIVIKGLSAENTLKVLEELSKND
jgi:hypothetical protein